MKLLLIKVWRNRFIGGQPANSHNIRHIIFLFDICWWLCAESPKCFIFIREENLQLNQHFAYQNGSTYTSSWSYLNVNVRVTKFDPEISVDIALVYVLSWMNLVHSNMSLLFLYFPALNEYMWVSDWKKALACIIMYFPADFLTHIIMWSAGTPRGHCNLMQASNNNNNNNLPSNVA